MRWSVIVALGACHRSSAEDGSVGDTGLTQAEFEDEFVAKWCDRWTTCGQGDCPIATGFSATTTGMTATCTFDPVAAQACLDSTFGCNDDFVHYETVVPDPVCDGVCSNAP